MHDKVNFADKLSRFTEHWRPRIICELNDSYVKLAKLHGEFEWHRHDREDELFVVLKGRLLLRFHDSEVWIGEGECIVVPRGVEHCPVAPEEVHIMLVEPKSTVNTGNVQNERTAESEWI